MTAAVLTPLLALAVTATTQAAHAAAPKNPGKALGQPVTTTITLITGDSIRYTRHGDGRVATAVTPAPGRENMIFHSRTGEDGHHFTIPADAQRAISSGLLDERLFDLTYLAENDYADSATGELPVILQYEQKAGIKKAKEFDGAGDPKRLASINAAAVEVTKKKAGAFWADATGPDAGLEKIWLDAKVEALDDVSNAQIGAPAAWAAGLDGKGVKVAVIDTGVDAAHPDLAGKIVSSRNFVPEGEPGGGAPDDVTDGHGHGTHVASTIAGSGAASEGRHKGVAPGAELAIAKALDDEGSGPTSSIIEAMEWAAATEDATIVSMSLGGAWSDGKDPLSQAVNDLTEEHGTLFVIAAGNDGPSPGTVSSPGAADAALTVGAVDAQDQIAEFSGRGPRWGDKAIKPEITAPGVGIVAARAAGTSMGSPVDDRYTAASGTSMATPHVAAAAAILAQQHPDWTPERLKNTLIGSTAPVAGTVFEYGSGRLDVARAVTQQVFSDTPSISGAFTYPYTGQGLTKTVTYTNTGTEPVDLALNLSMNVVGGGAAEPGFATLDRNSVTVPAGGTASVTLTFDPTMGVPATYSGRLEATGAAHRVVVPVSATKGVKEATLTVRLLSRPGLPIYEASQGTFTAILVNDTDPNMAHGPRTHVSNQWRPGSQPDSWELSLPVSDGGVYYITADPSFTEPGPAGRNHSALLIEPEFQVNGDTTLTLDLADTIPIALETERPSVPVTANLDYGRVTASGTVYEGASIFGYDSAAANTIWVTPTQAPAVGKAWFAIDQTLIAPQATLEAGKETLYPRYMGERHDDHPKFASDRRLTLVGQDVLRSGGDVRDRLVLTRPDTWQELMADARAATAARAAGLVTDSRFIGLGESWEEISIPALQVTREEADRLAKAGQVTVRAQAEAPYEYKLFHVFPDGVPESLTIASQDADLARREVTYHADYPAVTGTYGPMDDAKEVSHVYLPWEWISARLMHGFPSRTSRTEYYSDLGPDMFWLREYIFTNSAENWSSVAWAYHGSFAASSTGTESWNGLKVPGARQPEAGTSPEVYRGESLPCDSCRAGDVLRFRSLDDISFGQYREADIPGHIVQEFPLPDVEETHLYGPDGTEIQPVRDAFGLASYVLPAEAATYRATSTFRTADVGRTHGTRIDTTWTFRSERPSASTVAAPIGCLEHIVSGTSEPCAWQPMLMPTYQLGLSPTNTAPSGSHEFTVGAQSGVTAAGLAGARAWISPDDGSTWSEAKVKKSAENTFQVKVHNPKSGTITLKLETWDTTGNKVEQIIHDAYTIAS
ncbi:S8 family serine peptidase [Nonomuraea sp. GTA35]|uniref:S8 family serine peptidase n=1 Tax=Nonomuraea sp. GTA35 TaxID=1676746 RepID=UPI0035BEEC5E